MRYECIALPTELSWHWYKRLFVGLCVEFIRLMAEVIALPTELSWLVYKTRGVYRKHIFFSSCGVNLWLSEENDSLKYRSLSATIEELLWNHLLKH